MGAPWRFEEALNHCEDSSTLDTSFIEIDPRESALPLVESSGQKISLFAVLISATQIDELIGIVFQIV